MTEANVKVIIDRDIQTVWDKITSLTDYGWRSDLSRIEVSADGNSFVEYSQDGNMMTFTITVKEACTRYEFDMDNENMTGHWIGTLHPAGEGTEIDFTEQVEVKKQFMRPFVKDYLRRQQALYVKDLKAALQGG